MARMTRGRLPARVYWVRRLMVLGIATLLVVGFAKLLGGSSDGSGGEAATNVADAGPTSTPTSNAPASPDTGSNRKHHKKHKSVSDPVTRVAMPSGPCAPSDVAISPSVPEPVAGGDIDLVLDISSLETPACTWTLSGDTTALKITSGNDLIWTSSECPKTLGDEDLILRQGDPTRVKVTWDARRSEPGCPVRTEWALPGTYHLHVAALAGQPQDVTFVLTAPKPAQVTKTAHPHQHHGQHRHKKKQDSQSG